VGLIVGILAVVLVLSLIFAMALAEWADKDIGEFFASFFHKQSLTAAPSLTRSEKTPTEAGLMVTRGGSGSEKMSTASLNIESAKTAETKARGQAGRKKTSVRKLKTVKKAVTAKAKKTQRIKSQKRKTT